MLRGNRDKGPSNLGASLGTGPNMTWSPGVSTWPARRGGRGPAGARRASAQRSSPAPLTCRPVVIGSRGMRASALVCQRQRVRTIPSSYRISRSTWPLAWAPGSPLAAPGIGVRRVAHPRAPRPWDFAPLSTRVQGCAVENCDRQAQTPRVPPYAGRRPPGSTATPLTARPPGMPFAKQVLRG